MLPHSSKYRITNWSEYNNGLKLRGSLNIWFDKDISSKWYEGVSHKRGAPRVYSDFAITIILQLRFLFKQPLRQTEGLTESILKLMGLDIPTPDYTTLCRRTGKLKLKINRLEIGRDEDLVIIVDSTGLKVFGEGEWKVRKHGAAKNRRWKKVHIGIDKDGNIRDVLTTNNDMTDGEVINDLLKEESDINTLCADTGYDKRKVYNYCIENNVKRILIPPQKNAMFWKKEKVPWEQHPRNVTLKEIRIVGRDVWKKQSGYHARSLVENTMFRFKTSFTDEVSSQNDENQKVEVNIKCNILNKFKELGTPKSEKV